MTATMRRPGGALLLVLMLLVAACASAPPPQPAAPSQHARQVQTLRELGFVENDDGWLMNIAEPISFDFNRAELRDDLTPQLEDVARRLLAAQLDALRVEGHTDRVGARDYNESLSLRRSEAVAAVFVAQGFARSRVECKGLAWDYPVAPNETREGRAENRRVSVIVPASSMAGD